jgi:hypothetical protein
VGIGDWQKEHRAKGIEYDIAHDRKQVTDAGRQRTDDRR